MYNGKDIPVAFQENISIIYKEEQEDNLYDKYDKNHKENVVAAVQIILGKPNTYIFFIRKKYAIYECNIIWNQIKYHSINVDYNNYFTIISTHKGKDGRII